MLTIQISSPLVTVKIDIFFWISLTMRIILTQPLMNFGIV